MLIYKTTNILDGKFYIGQDARDNPEYLGSGLHLMRAIKKYGKENFVKETLQRCETKQELDEAEIYLIKKLDAIKLGYNIAAGGTGGKTRPKVWNKGLTKETDDRVRRNGQAVGQALIGHTQSDETKAKRAATLRSYPRTPEWCANISKGLTGKQLSADTRAKISATLKAKFGAEMLMLKCEWCGQNFTRKASRQRHRDKKGCTGPYCGHSCATKARHHFARNRRNT